MIRAARKNHIKIVELLFENGGTNLNRSTMAAASEGHEEMINKLLELNKTTGRTFIHVNLNSVMRSATHSGKKEIVARRFSVDAQSCS